MAKHINKALLNLSINDFFDEIDKTTTSIGEKMLNVMAYLLINNYLSNSEINLLRDKAYSKTLGCNYPVLVDINKDYVTPNRYYSDVVIHKSNEYRITNDWYDRQKSKINRYIDIFFAGKKIVQKVKNDKSIDDDFPFYSFDESTENVIYRENIPFDKRVEGLARNLEEWYSNVIDFAHKFYHHLFRENVNIELDSIPVYLSLERPTKDYKKDVAKLLKQKINEVGKDITEKDIRKIINNGLIKHKITGMFFANNGHPYIEIYYTNFNCNDFHKYLAEVFMTLAHEYNHYIHYKLSNPNEFKKNSDIACRVKESIADSFAYLCMKDNYTYDSKMDSVADERYQSWIDMSVSDWPYAYAIKYFNFKRTFDYKKYCKVFNFSSTDIKEAYKELIKD